MKVFSGRNSCQYGMLLIEEGRCIQNGTIEVTPK
jgi:hypothetical protein